MTTASSRRTSGIPQWTMLDRLRKARETAGFSKEDLAAALEVSRNTVGNYENGKVRPQPIVVKMWAMITGVPVEWIRTGTTPPDGGRARQDSNLRPEDYKSPTSVIIDLTAERARRRTSTRDVELPHVAKVLQFPSRMLAAA